MGRCLTAAMAMFALHAHVAADATLGLASYASPKVQHQSVQLLGSLRCALVKLGSQRLNLIPTSLQLEMSCVRPDPFGAAERSQELH